MKLCTVCVRLSVRVLVSVYLLVLSDRLLLLLDASELQVVGPVPPRNHVSLRAVGAADLAARTRGFVDVGAGRTRPTLRGGTNQPTTLLILQGAIGYAQLLSCTQAGRTGKKAHRYTQEPGCGAFQFTR